MSKPTASKTQGVHHVGLTVPSLQETRDFFVDLLGFAEIGGVPDYPAVFISDGSVMLTLWQADASQPSVDFDRRCNIGLHHLALAVADAEALAALSESLRDVPGVAVEFEPEPLGGTGLRHMMCTIPGGIRVEFVAAG